MDRFKAKKELEVLKNKYDKLQEELEYYQTETEALREQIEKMKNGERCASEYCTSCKHSVESGRYEYEMLGGRRIILGGGRRICALDVPCSDYEQEE